MIARIHYVVALVAWCAVASSALAVPITEAFRDNFDTDGPGNQYQDLTDNGWVVETGATDAGQENGVNVSGPKSAFFQTNPGDGSAIHIDTGINLQPNYTYNLTFHTLEKSASQSYNGTFTGSLYAGDPTSGGTLLAQVSTTNVISFNKLRFTTDDMAMGDLYLRFDATGSQPGTGFRQPRLDNAVIESAPVLFHESFDQGFGGGFNQFQALAANGWVSETGASDAGQESNGAQPTPDSGIYWGFLQTDGSSGSVIHIDTGVAFEPMTEYTLKYFTGGKNNQAYTGELMAELWLGDPTMGGTLLGSGLAANPTSLQKAFNSHTFLIAGNPGAGNLFIRFNAGLSGNGAFQQPLIDSVVLTGAAIPPVPEPATGVLALLGLGALVRRRRTA